MVFAPEDHLGLFYILRNASLFRGWWYDTLPLRGELKCLPSLKIYSYLDEGYGYCYPYPSPTKQGHTDHLLRVSESPRVRSHGDSELSLLGMSRIYTEYNKYRIFLSRAREAKQQCAETRSLSFKCRSSIRDHFIFNSHGAATWRVRIATLKRQYNFYICRPIRHPEREVTSKVLAGLSAAVFPRSFSQGPQNGPDPKRKGIALSPPLRSQRSYK